MTQQDLSKQLDVDVIRWEPSVRKRLVFIRVGGNSLHYQWFKPDAPRSWDLMLSYYAQPEQGFDLSPEMVIAGGLSKFTSVAGLLNKHPECLDRYDSVLFLDDDLEYAFESIDVLFSLRDRFGLSLCQAALTPDSFHSHTILVQQSGFILRYVNFVEIMMPLFSRQALKHCLDTFTKSISGYGLDFVWPHLLGSPQDQIAVIDVVQARHTKPIDEENGHFYRHLRQLGIDPHQEMSAIPAHYNCQIQPHRVFGGWTGESLDGARQVSFDPEKKATAPVHVINLDRSENRFAEFIENNRIAQLEIVRIAAVDGKQMDRQELIRNGVITEDLIFIDNAVACALSHMKCWRLAVQNQQNITVCEDDAIFHSAFNSVVTSFTDKVPDFDVLYWGYNLDMHLAYEMPGFGEFYTMFKDSHFFDKANQTAFQTQTLNVNMYRLIRAYGTICYTISPKGAQKLLSLIRPLGNANGKFRMPLGMGTLIPYVYESWGIDVHMSIHEVGKLDAYALLPPVVISPNDPTTSTIGDKERVLTSQDQNSG